MSKKTQCYQCILTYDPEDGIYYANFIDFRDCFADGEDEEEALYYAKDVLELYIDKLKEKGHPIAKPSRTILPLTKNQKMKYIEVEV